MVFLLYDFSNEFSGGGYTYIVFSNDHIGVASPFYEPFHDCIKYLSSAMLYCNDCKCKVSPQYGFVNALLE